MPTSSSTVDHAVGCTLCPETHQSSLVADDFCWTTVCTRYEVPIVVLKRHTDSPTAGEWHRVESLAKRRFPDFRWKRPTPVTKHFYIHAVELGVRCGHDHTELEHRHSLPAFGQSRREVAAFAESSSPFRTATVGAGSGLDTSYAPA